MPEPFLSRARRLVAENEGGHRYCTMDPGPHEALRMLGPLLDVVEALKSFKEMQRAHGLGDARAHRAWDALDSALARLEVTNG